MTEDHNPATSPRAAERTAAAWRSPLTWIVGGLLIFEIVTGLVVWLGSFSLTAQFMLLGHTIAGVIGLVPLTWYVVKHWIGVSQQKFSHHKVTGYASFASLLVCCVSGAVLTWQATLGTRISYAWDTIHIVSGLAVLAITGLHIVTIVLRDGRKTAPTAAPVRGAQIRFALGAMAVALLLEGATLVWQFSYEAPDLSWKLPSDYGYSYGENPFAPSMATTATAGPIHPEALSRSKSCGASGCHEQIYEEWLPSAHRYASTDIAFQAVQKVMAANEGPESTRYCAGCHDPIALFSGSKNIYDEDLSSPGAEEAVSCIACHRIMQTDVKGNASYTMAAPEFYAYEMDESSSGKLLSAFLIRAYPKQHVHQYSPPLLKSPEYCAACHKQFIDEEINDFGWVQLQNQFDNWRKSHWNQEGNPDTQEFCNDCHERKSVELPPDLEGRCSAITVSCRECHMPLRDSTDPAAGDPTDLTRRPGDGKHRDHHFIGANQLMPKVLNLPGWEKHTEMTEAWLRGHAVVPEIAHKWPVLSEAYRTSKDLVPTPVVAESGPILPIKLQVEGDEVKPGEPVRYKVEIRSRKVGHDFPTGPLDIIQCWVETEVVDAKGRVLYHSGHLTDSNFVEEGSFIFKAEGVDAQGNLIDRHNLWELVGARFKRALFPGFTDTARYEFQCPNMAKKEEIAVEGDGDHGFALPDEVEGPVTFKARLLYRKVNQHLLNIVLGRTDVTAPITVIDTDELTLPLAGSGEGR